MRLLGYVLVYLPRSCFYIVFISRSIFWLFIGSLVRSIKLYHSVEPLADFCASVLISFSGLTGRRRAWAALKLRSWLYAGSEVSGRWLGRAGRFALYSPPHALTNLHWRPMGFGTFYSWCFGNVRIRPAIDFLNLGRLLCFLIHGHHYAQSSYL